MATDTDPFLTPRQLAILDSFNYHRPSPEQVLRISGLRGAFKNAARAVIAATPEGADQTAALRQLHEAMMTANKAIALEPGTPIEPALGEQPWQPTESPWHPREFELPRPALPSCRVPPAGWTCSRGAGHPGPCAASPATRNDDPNPGV